MLKIKFIYNKNNHTCSFQVAMALKNVVIMGDSWLIKHRMVHEKIREKEGQTLLDISPHTSNEKNGVLIKNLSKGGLTLQQILENRDDILGRWVELRPKVTLLHALGCDIANNTTVNTQGSVANDYVRRILAYLLKMSVYIKSRLTDQEFQRWNEDHKFILVAAPDWGNLKKSRPQSLSASQYKDVRRKINQQLKKKRLRFWNEIKALVITPRMNNPQLEGVHLRPKSQEEYNTHIVTSIGRVICDKCTFQTKETADNLERTLSAGCNASS